MPTLEQFPYESLEFRGDTELALPPGGAWGDMGKYFYFLNIYFLLNFVHKVVYTYVLESDMF